MCVNGIDYAESVIDVIRFRYRQPQERERERDGFSGKM